jgi:tetratricopeptide (TPR) repeat protein
MRLELQHFGEGLVVLDDVEDSSVLNALNVSELCGHVLITSRSSDWQPPCQTLRLSPFTREESIEYLLKRTGHSDSNTANSIAGELGDLPLALEQAGAFIEGTHSSMTEYLDTLEINARDLLKTASPRSDYSRSVALSIGLALDRLAASDARASEILNLLAFFDSRDIPMSLVTAFNDVGPTPLSRVSRADLDHGLRSLFNASFISLNGDSIDVHKLVQTVARERLAQQHLEDVWLKRALVVLAAGFSFRKNDSRTWVLAGRLVPHILKCVALAERIGMRTPDTSRLLLRVSALLLEKRQLGEAEQTVRWALKLTTGVNGETSPEVARATNQLAQILRAEGSLDEALSCARRALMLNERIWGDTHAYTASAASTVSQVLLAQGKFEEALRFTEIAQQINASTYGRQNPFEGSTATTMAQILLGKGDFQGALQHARRALEIDTSNFGQEHPYVANVHLTIGSVLHALLQYDEALFHFESALKINTTVLGDHIYTADVFSKIAAVLRDTGALQKALINAERALEITERLYAAEHPQVAIRTLQVGEILRSMGAYNDALRYFQRSLELLNHSQIVNGPDLAPYLRTVADVYNALGRPDDARTALRKALAHLGSDAPLIGEIKSRLALLDGGPQ